MLNKLKQIIYDTYAIDDFNPTSKIKLYTDARMQFIYRAVQLGKTLVQIGKYLDKDHSTILHSYSNYIDYLQYDLNFFLKAMYIDEMIKIHYEELIESMFWDKEIAIELDNLIANAVIFENHIQKRHKKKFQSVKEKNRKITSKYLE